MRVFVKVKLNKNRLKSNTLNSVRKFAVDLAYMGLEMTVAHFLVVLQ